ncbi:MAG: hypothetical protein OXF01_08225 [Gemmatimonadetes bacterium]|nr:hypothetical protein [Gemmatimonadota bacterium]
MSCPDLTSLGRVAADNTDPALLRHLQQCATCRRDLEMAEAVRRVLYPDIMVPTRLNARVMERVRARAARLKRRAGPPDLLITGILAGAGSYAAVVATAGEGFLASNPHAVVFGVIGGVIVAWYHRWRSDRERARVDRRLIDRPTAV